MASAVDDDSDVITLTLPHTFTGVGQMIFECDNPGANAGDTDALFTRLTALRVNNITVQP